MVLREKSKESPNISANQRGISGEREKVQVLGSNGKSLNENWRSSSERGAAEGFQYEKGTVFEIGSCQKFVGFQSKRVGL